MIETFTQPKNNNSVIEEPAMVTGFVPARLHVKLRRIAAEQGCSESALVSKFVREALLKPRRVMRELL